MVDGDFKKLKIYLAPYILKTNEPAMTSWCGMVKGSERGSVLMHDEKRNAEESRSLDPFHCSGVN
jgi:hypothetical protein